MLTLTTGKAAIAGIIIALWTIAAVWAVVTGLLMRRRAGDAAAEAGRLSQLLGASPSVPMLIRIDGRVEAPDKLGDWLGLGRVPNFVVDFAGTGNGLTDEDATALAKDVTAAQKSAKPFVRSMRPQESSRTLLMRGARAPAAIGGGVLVWVYDATESQVEIGKLGGEVARLTRAFDALTQLIEAAPIPMWHRGPDLRLTLVNRAYVEAVDAASAEDAVARGLELVEIAGGVGPIAAASAARDAGEVRSRIVPATIAGQRRSVRIVDVPLGDAGVAGYALDNDDLERANGAFRRFADAQRDTLDRLSAGVAQFGADRSLTFCNMPFQRMFALKPEWVADRPEFDRVLERMREAGRVPEVRDFPGWKAERREWFTSADGATEEAWLLAGGLHLRVVAQPLPDGGLLLIFEDRTEQVQLASARDTLLRVREATFDNLFEAIGVFAGDGRLHVWNNKFREVWGFDEALLASHPRVDTLAEAAAPSLSSPQRASLIRDLVRTATIERKARSGRVALKDGRHFEFAAVPLPDGNALFTMLDITDSRRIERALRDRTDALEAADKVKSAFVANMSYELRTPLTSIGGFAEMLSQGYAGTLSDQAGDYVKAILESVAKLGLLVDDVLQMTQSDAKLIAVDRETVDLVQLLDAVAVEHEAAIADKNQELVRDFSTDTGRVAGDAKPLRDAIGLLLAGAIADTPAEGRILIHASGTSEGALLVVSDNGPGSGSDPAMLTRVRSLVGAAGGRVTAMAEPGEGTAVQITLTR
ncbi:histidine kinase [Sphingomonas paeninsulae]|uniref:histidine kinase n=1 Tax=Sphingomonas paeninsulae TaxID=2319844 RepID=A0A494TKA7_SPHPE|nr:PAS domain-containing sensor histidine kinase [Sphingomonas paeninsulae]AYJ85555.1 histidine kinase [Sphingomonas paeninsulae]